MKFRFALLVAALALALSISAFAYSEEPTQDAAAPAQEETTSEDSTPFVLLRVYEGQFADVKGGDWFAPSVVSAYEYGVLNGRGEDSFAPSGNVTIAELLTIAARLRAIYTTGSDAVIPTAKENEAWYAPYVSYLKSQNLLDNSFEGFYLLPASRAQMAGIFAFAVPEEWYTEPNASLVTSAYARRSSPPLPPARPQPRLHRRRDGQNALPQRNTADVPPRAALRHGRKGQLLSRPQRQPRGNCGASDARCQT